MRDSEKERIKLHAAAVDRVSTVCLTVGVFSPFALHQAYSWYSFFSMLAWLAAGGIFHYIAYSILGGLDQ